MVDVREKPYREGENNAYEYVIKRLGLNEPCAVVSMSGLGKRYLFTGIKKYSEEHMKEFLILSYNITDRDECTHILDVILNAERPVIMIVKISFNGDCFNFLKALNTMRTVKYTNFLPIIIGNVSNVFTSLEANNKLLTKSLHILKPNSREDSERVLSEFEKKYNKKIPQRVKDKIIFLSGGHTGFIKSLFLTFIDDENDNFDIEKLITEESFLCWINELLSDLPEDKTDALTTNRPGLYAEFLEKYGYTNSGKIFSPLFEAFLKKKNVKKNTSDNFEHQLSNQEAEVFNLLKEFLGEIVTREEIAKVHWKDEWVEKYSDWSIDQTIYRIRKKIIEHNLPFQINTRKGRGFMMLMR